MGGAVFVAMKLFQRRKRDSAKVESADPGRPESPASSGDGAELLDGALDALSHCLRVFGTQSFPLDESEPHDDFVSLCMGWSRHVATGVAPEVAGPEDDDQQAPKSAERRFKELRHFYGQRRRDERKYVEARVGGLRRLIWELLDGLRSLAGSERSAQGSITSSLTALERAAQSESPVSELRGAVQDAIGEIKLALESQRQTLEHELSAMGKRLAGMREELLEAKKQLEIDPLTKLYNRGAFDAGAARYSTLSVLSGQPLTLLMVDLDHFKQVNDRYGHPVGDRVLVAAANTIVRTFPRKNDFVARYGGEEFAVIVFDVDRTQAARLCSRLLSNVRETRLEDIPELVLSCSVGYAELEAGESVGQLVERADRALYQAKEAGRDRAVEGQATIAFD